MEIISTGTKINLKSSVRVTPMVEKRFWKPRKMEIDAIFSKIGRRIRLPIAFERRTIIQSINPYCSRNLINKSPNGIRYENINNCFDGSNLTRDVFN